MSYQSFMLSCHDQCSCTSIHRDNFYSAIQYLKKAPSALA